MTLREFARRTGWPYRELMDTPADEFIAVVVAMGCTLKLVPLRKRRRREPECQHCPVDGSCWHCGRTV